MRKVVFIWVILLLAGVNMAYAQDVKTVVDSVKSNVKESSVKDAVSDIADAFKVKMAKADEMIGTWQYVEPAVYATKGNLLYKLAGNSVGTLWQTNWRRYSTNTLRNVTLLRRTVNSPLIVTERSIVTFLDIRLMEYGWLVAPN